MTCMPSMLDTFRSSGTAWTRAATPTVPAVYPVESVLLSDEPAIVPLYVRSRQLHAPVQQHRGPERTRSP